MIYFCSKCEKQREQGCFLLRCSGIPIAWPKIPPPPPKPEATGDRDLMQQALKLLVSYREYTGDHRIANSCSETIDAIEAELAKPEKEPVKCNCGYSVGHPLMSKCICTSRKEWVGLTDEVKND